ncbi:MAG: hypothetical protein PF693_18390 [Spirochaetia bacterium]|jgi:hypothetical protein|nr:hypothetical protein [Spirochaetia bacterium]
MVQIYLLSIVANVIAGITLASGYLGNKLSFFSVFKGLRENRVAEITLGLSTAVIGVLKLIIRSPAENIPVAGDLLPALAGIALGLILLSEAFRSKVEAASEPLEKASRVVFSYRVPVGIAGMIIGILHFFFSGVLFL